MRGSSVLNLLLLLVLGFVLVVWVLPSFGVNLLSKFGVQPAGDTEVQSQSSGNMPAYCGQPVTDGRQGHLECSVLPDGSVSTRFIADQGPSSIPATATPIMAPTTVPQVIDQCAVVGVYVDGNYVVYALTQSGRIFQLTSSMTAIWESGELGAWNEVSVSDVAFTGWVNPMKVVEGYKDPISMGVASVSAGKLHIYVPLKNGGGIGQDMEIPCNG